MGFYLSEFLLLIISKSIMIIFKMFMDAIG